MQALINPNATAQYVSSWAEPSTQGGLYTPVYSQVLNSQQVAEVADNAFPVAEPLFWTDCPNDVIAYLWYYDKNSFQFIPVPQDAPYPVTSTQGAQIL